MLRLLRGESLGASARECGQPPRRDRRLAGGLLRLWPGEPEGERAAAPEERDLLEAQRKSASRRLKSTPSGRCWKNGVPRFERRSR